MAFDGNDYRKRVLAAIDARGGLQTSDVFEHYDLPLHDVDRLADREVAAQVDAVWAFWQKQRDHPKYRGLVTALLGMHGEVAPRLRDGNGRRGLAEDARRVRAEREAARCLPLDAAIARLVERFGGLPADKVEGLRAVAAAAGLDERTTEERIAAHVVLEVVTAAPAPAPGYRQVRDDLLELGLLGVEAPASLYDLLGLPPGAPVEQVSDERTAAAARNRELRPDRRRALVDDLLAAVTTLLVRGDPDAYLEALAADVRGQLRPRVAMVVLVEDGLGPEDAAQILAEARAAGLDPPRALRVLTELAAESGVRVPPGLTAGAQDGPARAGRAPVGPAPVPTATGRPGRRPPARSGAWQEPLAQARAALRAGRVLEAQGRVGEARQLAGGMLPPLRVVVDEVEAVLREARQCWAEAAAGLAAGRPTQAAVGLERLAVIAADLPGPAGESVQHALAGVRDRLALAAGRAAVAALLDGEQRERALLEALDLAPDSEQVLAALRATGVAPPAAVRAERVDGGVRVSWQPSVSRGPVDYSVLGPEGRVLGSTRGTELEVGLGPGVIVPTYAVVARRAGIASAPAFSGAADPPAAVPCLAVPSTAVPSLAVPPAAVPSLAVLAMGSRLRLVFAPPPRGRAEVRRLPDGAAAPRHGTVVADPAQLGTLVPAMGPGLAVDRRPAAPLVRYVVLTVDGIAVAGASAAWVDLPGLDGVRLRHDRLCWRWPAAPEQAVVCWRADAPPLHAEDPAGTSRSVTREQYEDEGGVELPPGRPLHVAVFPAVRVDGRLHPGPDGARLHLPGG